MTDATIFPTRGTAKTGLVRFIAPAFPVAAVVYAAATMFVLPVIGDAGSVIDVFLGAALPGLIVTLLLWALRPDVYRSRQRCALVALSLLAATAMSVLPMLVSRS